MTTNKALLALALGMAFAALTTGCNPPEAQASNEPAAQQAEPTTTHPEEAMKNTSMHSRFVVERRFVYGIETHILIDGETGMECVRNAKYYDTPWTCVVTR